MKLRTVVQPATEPLTLAEAKEYLRLDGNDHNSTLTALIRAAREYCEAFQNRAYITRTLELYLDKFQFPIRLPMAPLGQVLFFQYEDSAGDTHDFEDYIVDNISQPGMLHLAYGKAAPSTTLKPVNAIIIRYTAGYGANAPESAKLAMKLFIGHRFENPEVEGVPAAVHHLLWPERVVPV